MKRIPFALTLVVIILLMIVLAASTPSIAAQEATVEAAPVAIVTAEPEGNTTVEDGGAVINIEQPAETPVTPVEQKSFLSSILEFAVGAIVGAGVALGSAAAYIRSAMNDPVKMTLAETAARNISPETLAQILDFLKSAQEFVVEATDGVPMITKPRPTPPSAQSTPSQDSM